MNIKTFQPDFTEKGKRIDAYLSEQIPELTRSAIQLLIQNSQIKINDSVPKKNYRILGTETITVEQEEPHEVEIIPENIPIDIIYEDQDTIVVNKERGTGCRSLRPRQAPGEAGCSFSRCGAPRLRYCCRRHRRAF